MSTKHKPTSKQKAKVKEATGFGITQDLIASLIGIDEKTLRKYYRDELDLGKAEAHFAVAGTLFDKCITDKDTTSLIWWTKTQMGWSENKQETDDESPSLNINFSVKEQVADIKITNAKT